MCMIYNRTKRHNRLLSLGRERVYILLIKKERKKENLLGKQEKRMSKNSRTFYNLKHARHGTTPFGMKEVIEDVSSVLANEV
ncbi:UNVERIFIED_CONTAM: hypothetical protein NCL1_12173 [Trichonephila clavipes]